MQMEDKLKFLKATNEGIYYNPPKKNNALIPESDKKPKTDQHVYRHLDIHLCCCACFAYHHRTLGRITVTMTTNIRWHLIVMENWSVQLALAS